MAPLILLLFLFRAISVNSQSPDALKFLGAQEPTRKTTYRLSKPLVGDNGKIYTCSDRNFFAFESNGSIAWSVHINFTCYVDIPPYQDEFGKIYLVAENKILKINPPSVRNPESTFEIFFGKMLTTEGSNKISGMAVSVISSLMFITVENRALFAYTLRGQRLWSAGPVLYRSGYRVGCKRNVTDCHFTSAPVVDQCEGSVYISNTYGELYALVIRNPQFKWIQDLSEFDKLLTITPGNNGLVYVTFPVKALLLALDVFTGNILWQKNIGPLSTIDCSPIVDSNGWISIGSLDGFLYSFSPSGDLRKFPKANVLDSVALVSPLLHCSGYAIYFSQTVMEGKTSRTIGDFTYISVMKPKNVVFTMLVPATGSVYWSGTYTGQFASFLNESILQYFAMDERILLAFVAAGNMGNPLQCRTTRQNHASSCSLAKPKHLSIYAENERTLLLYLLFESLVLIILLCAVRFCCIFWGKEKLKNQDLGTFLENRRSLQEDLKVFDRAITKQKQNAAVGDEASRHEAMEKLGILVKERDGIARKLSTTYSLGRDKCNESISKSVLPLYDDKTYTSSSEGTSDYSGSHGSSSREDEAKNLGYDGDEESALKGKKKVESDEAGPSNTSAGKFKEMDWESSAVATSCFAYPLYIHGEKGGSTSNNNRLKRTLSSIN
ncbi:protein GAMETE EXPRESSED 3-like [Papaver somniferum]|uniref:protein GAMETE EXPRESSED 3-like n=1 Tax=Papaver somniferum TaxID=3469 RepID=UPI000E6FD707|nr:protein GAMETE EXPRESSED 3-like [Papaver somniferum]